MLSLRNFADCAVLPAPTGKESSFSAQRPKFQAPWPSLPSSKPSKASLSDSVAVINMAPAPSPKRTQVLRSDQSTHQDKPSAPMTTELCILQWCHRPGPRHRYAIRQGEAPLMPRMPIAMAWKLPKSLSRLVGGFSPTHLKNMI